MTDEELAAREDRRRKVLALLEAHRIDQNDLAMLMRLSPQALSLMLHDADATFPAHRFAQALEAIALLAPTAIQITETPVEG